MFVAQNVPACLYRWAESVPVFGHDSVALLLRSTVFPVDFDAAKRNSFNEPYGIQLFVIQTPKRLLQVLPVLLQILHERKEGKLGCRALAGFGGDSGIIHERRQRKKTKNLKFTP